VQGCSLAQLLAEGPMALPMCVDIGLQIARALEAAHASGIIHRDLKPGNIMMAEGGFVKLLDFGLAKRLALSPDIGQTLTGVAPETIQGGFAGTAAYVSPEIAQGKPCDARSDVFSFGSVFYEMITGERPFEGDTPIAVLANVIHAAVIPPSRKRPDLSAQFDSLIAGCLAKDPSERLTPIAKVRVQLEAIRDRTPQKAPLKSSPRRWINWAASSALALGIVLTVVELIHHGTFRGTPVGGIVEHPILSRITSDARLSGYPALSPDGKLIAYASDRGGENLNLWLQQVGGGDPIRLTNTLADDYQPSFSPDGTTIAFRSERSGGGVYVVPAFGGSERLLAPGCRNPRYSPDGRWVACWTGAQFLGGAFYPGVARILLVPASGGQAVVFRPDFLTSAVPIWTADSRSLLFLGRRPDPAKGKDIIDWWTASLDGKDAKSTGALQTFKDAGLSPPPGAYWIVPESWMKTPDSILFTATHGDATNIWALRRDSTGSAAGQPTRITLGTSIDASPRVVGNSGQAAMVFASLTLEVGIWKLPLRPDGSAAADPQLLFSGQPGLGSPSISEDGATLVFSSIRSGGARVIEFNIPTSAQRVVTTIESTRPPVPIVSRDGNMIAFLRGATGNLMRRNDGIPEQICPRCGTLTSVNSNGSEVLFESGTNDERLQLWSNGELKPLIHGTDPRHRSQFSGRISPNGKWVVFSAAPRDSPLRQIVVVPKTDRAITTEEWAEISDGANEGPPAWSSDGKRIYFVSERDGFPCIWARPVDLKTSRPTGPVYSIAHFHHATRVIRTMRASRMEIGFSAIRDALIFTIAANSGNVWMQSGWADK
jgi:Tol biopolymer transport system component